MLEDHILPYSYKKCHGEGGRGILPKGDKKQKSRSSWSAFLLRNPDGLIPLLCSSSVNFAGTKATGTNCNGLRCTVNDRLYLADIGFPSSVCFAMWVRNGLTENYSLSANTALCHIDTSSMHRSACDFLNVSIERLLLYHIFLKNARVFLKKIKIYLLFYIKGEK